MTQVFGQIVSCNLVYGPLNLFVCSRPSRKATTFSYFKFDEKRVNCLTPQYTPPPALSHPVIILTPCGGSHH